VKLARSARGQLFQSPTAPSCRMRKRVHRRRNRGQPPATPRSDTAGLLRFRVLIDRGTHRVGHVLVHRSRHRLEHPPHRAARVRANMRSPGTTAAEGRRRDPMPGRWIRRERRVRPAVDHSSPASSLEGARRSAVLIAVPAHAALDPDLLAHVGRHLPVAGNQVGARTPPPGQSARGGRCWCPAVSRPGPRGNP